MNKVKILTDTTADLTDVSGKNVLDQLDVDYISLSVAFENEVFQDWKEIRPKELYKRVEEGGKLPKSSCGSPEDYRKFFEKYVNEGYDVVFTGISSDLSGAYRSAVLAAKEFDEGRVYVIDSLNLSSAIGLQIMKACKWRNEGMSAKEIAEKIAEIAPKVKCKFVVDTLDYLYKGGRCSGMTKVIGTILNLKPIIAVTDGKLDVWAKARGKKNGLKMMFDDFAKDYKAGNIDMDHIMITHTVVVEEAEYLKEKMLEIGVPENVIMFSEANCVICTHCGPKCIGILYITKNGELS